MRHCMRIISMWTICAMTLLAQDDPTEQLVWRTSYEKALNDARNSGKLILLVAGRNTCGNTQHMRNMIAASSKIRPIVDSYFIPWYASVDHFSDWQPYASGFGSFSLPLIATINPNAPQGDYLDRTTGVRTETAFESRLLDITSSMDLPPRGAFGAMRQVDSNRFISDDFGELSFEGDGQDLTKAFSFSLQADLREKNGQIFSDLYGVLRPNPWGLPQWIISDYFGLIHFGEEGDQYAGWVSSERFGWMRFVDAGGGDRFLWVHRLQTWMAVNPGGSFHSFDFGLLEPETGSLTRYNSRIGILVDDEFNPPGWMRSDRFGFVWFARDGTGVWFWSSNRNEWIGITQDGGLWSTEEERFL
jgi:hypothetical protein